MTKWHLEGKPVPKGYYFKSTRSLILWGNWENVEGTCISITARMKEIGYLAPWELLVVICLWQQRRVPKIQKKKKKKRRKKTKNSRQWDTDPAHWNLAREHEILSHGWCLQLLVDVSQGCKHQLQSWTGTSWDLKSAFEDIDMEGII